MHRCVRHWTRPAGTLWLIALVAGLLAVMAPRPARASDPVGVYALVEDTVIEPAEDGADQIRIFGVFALAVRPDARQHGWYTDPAEGYLYYRCPEGQAEVCRLEWADIRKAIGSGKCAAFGQRPPYPEAGTGANGRVRPYTEPPASPDVYPVGYGVQLIEHGWLETCTALRAFRLTATPPAPGSTEAPKPTDVATVAVPTSAGPEPTSVSGPEKKPPGAAQPPAPGFMPFGSLERPTPAADGPATAEPAAAAGGAIQGRGGILAVLGLLALAIGTAVVWLSQRRDRLP
jgi:uncharacterized protein YjeT (DUF2065 family)